MSLRGRGIKEPSGVFYKDSNPNQEGSALPRAPPSKYHSLWVLGFQCMNSGGGTNIQIKALSQINISAAPIECYNSHRQYVKKWV